MKLDVHTKVTEEMAYSQSQLAPSTIHRLDQAVMMECEAHGMLYLSANPLMRMSVVWT